MDSHRAKNPLPSGMGSVNQTPNINGLRGKLIVFEGVEGCGKTTQLKRLHEWLQSLSTSVAAPMFVVVTREPGGTELGLGIRKLLLQAAGGKPIQKTAELLLFAADRSAHVEELLKPQLASGTIVLCDRYTDSTIAYQGYGRGLELSLLNQLNSIATGGLESDLTLWLDVDVEVGLARKLRGSGLGAGGSGRSQESSLIPDLDRIEQEDLAFHQRVRQGYIELAKAHPQRIVRVDANLSEDVVQEQIREILSQWTTGFFTGG